MTNKRLLLPLLLITVTLVGCAPFATSKRDRALLFEADLNGAREFLYQNFLESETVDYATIRDYDPGQTWDTWFPPGFPDPGTYTITLDTFFGNPLEATVDGPSAFEGPKTLKLHFIRSGIYWYLEGLTLESTKIVD